MPNLRRLRLVLGRDPNPGATEPPATVDGPLPPQVEFVAYAEDCLLSGYVRLGADRLTDLLDDHDELELVDVHVQGLDASTGTQVPEFVVRRDELLLVHAGNPRGNRGRRRRTLQHPVALEAGPYHVRGYIHTVPGSDPIASFRHRRPMVPITDAWVDYLAGNVRQRRRVPTLIVNRDFVDWIVEAVDDEVEMPELQLSAQATGLLRDYTGDLRHG
jgi:hypothetical protein